VNSLFQLVIIDTVPMVFSKKMRHLAVMKSNLMFYTAVLGKTPSAEWMA